MDADDFSNLFIKASRLDPTKHYLSHEERTNDWENMQRENGILQFKRKAMGFCGWKTLKSLDELADLFVKTGIASSMEQGREYAFASDGKEISYAPCLVLCFDKVTVVEGEYKFRIKKVDYAP